MMRGHGITTVAAMSARQRSRRAFLEESAALQLRMLDALGGDATRIRAFTREEAARQRLSSRRESFRAHGSTTRASGGWRGRSSATLDARTRLSIGSGAGPLHEFANFFASLRNSSPSCSGVCGVPSNPKSSAAARRRARPARG
jgi:hypothetical protein